MNRIAIRLATLLAVVVAAQALHAQSGCNDSPEAPTDVLLGVGAIGAYFGSSLLRKGFNRWRGR